MTKQIPLTQGKFALVDDDMFDYLNQWKWHCANGYAIRHENWENGKRPHILMHREILQTPDGMDTDHINHNKLDNRRSNLRVCTNSQNHSNALIQSNNTSGRRGVSWHKHARKWQAYIKVHRKVHFLGYFDNLENASSAYNEAAQKYFGEFAFTNLEKIR